MNFRRLLLSGFFLGASLTTAVPARAETIAFSCTAIAEAPPPEWVGGSWTGEVTVQVDTIARTVEMFDTRGGLLAGTARPARLARLNNHELDIKITDRAVIWGVVQMWGFSGYLDRQSGRLDLLWTNPEGFSAATLTRQFHGTCTPR